MRNLRESFRPIRLMRKRFISRIAYAINPQLIYDRPEFYDNTREQKTDTAEAASQMIVEYFNPAEVVDIGCGEGLFLNALHQKGVKGIGGDISEMGVKFAPKDFVVFQADATKPIRFNKRFDLCICIEIAEHIPKKCSKQLVENLVNASNTLFFTAATPGQGGVGHINEQPHEFWLQLFAAHGYQLDTAVSEAIKTKLTAMKERGELQVATWLTKNIMILRKQPA